MCRRASKLPEPAVRRLGAADMAAWRALRLEGLAAHPLAFGGDTAEEAALTDSDWLARIEGRPVFGAFIGDTLVGTASLAVRQGRKNAHIGELVGMYVSQEGRGRGVGRALITAVLDAARGVVEVVQLGVGIHNAPAIALYLAMGFRAFAVEEDALRVDGVVVDEVLMRRQP
jgi:ribosomal protein S18 acetylase RimI-like enzyme